MLGRARPSQAAGVVAADVGPGRRRAHTGPCGFGLRLRWLGLALGWTLGWLASPAAHALTPQATSNEDLRWRTIESKHFILNYPAGLEQMADHAIVACERAYEQLADDFGYHHRERIFVRIDDTHDSANGFAIFGPNPRMRLRATAPSTMSTLSSHDDWMQVLITHELAHLMHHGTVHGIPKAINLIVGLGRLGRVWAPSALMPRWFTEGVATYLESAYTSQGRMRASVHDMMLRGHVLEQRVADLDQISSGSRVFPFATGMYLYGSHILHFIANRYGKDTLRAMLQDYGTRFVPYGLGKMVQRQLGIDLDQLYREFRQHSIERFEAQARRIRSQGLRQGRRLTFSPAAGANLEHDRNPIWSADGNYIYYFGHNGHRIPGLWRVPSDGSAVREGVGIGGEGSQPDAEPLIRIDAGTLGGFVDDSETEFIFASPGNHDMRYNWSDLYLWKRGQGETFEQLTYGMRARWPRVAPDGRSVAFVRNDSGQSRVAILDLTTRKVRELAPIDQHQRVHDPTWSPDGRYIAYSVWRMGGYRDIVEFDRETGETQHRTASRHIDMTPAYSPDGRYLLYASDPGGVFNIYAIDRSNGRRYQVSNVLGGAFQPAVSPDGSQLAYMGYSSIGYDIWRMPFDPETWTLALPLPAALPLADGPPGLNENYATADKPHWAKRRPSTDSRAYRASQGFFPRTLVTNSLEFGGGNFLSNINLGARLYDGVGRHSLVVSGSYLLDRKQVVGNIDYNLALGFPQLGIEVHRWLYDVRAGLRWDRRPNTSSAAKRDELDERYSRERYVEENLGLNIRLEIPVLSRVRHGLSATVGYTLDVLRNHEADLGYIDPNAPAGSPYPVGRNGRLWLRFFYSSVTGRTYGFGSEEGRSSQVFMAVHDKAFGSEFEGVTFSLTHAEYIPMPWRGHHVLALRGNAGWVTRGISRFDDFALGGYRDTQDILMTILSRKSTGEAGRLRGYRHRIDQGRRRLVINSEYRFPLFQIDRGPSSGPLFLRQLRGAVFTDWGAIWRDELKREHWHGSIGGTLTFDLTAGHRMGTNISFQYARTIDDDPPQNYFRALVLSSF